MTRQLIPSIVLRSRSPQGGLEGRGDAMDHGYGINGEGDGFGRGMSRSGNIYVARSGNGFGDGAFWNQVPVLLRVES